ncbi:methyltransferase domain-containing protein [Kribbella sp. NPDC023855]|uniref:class I SAM-dependent methyltransferase n=1 Tax=Kribbella sp. NPDC023855 TaxID=3154698 RepID=UPI0033D564EC
MTEQHRFDREYWEQHWAGGALGTHPPNPYLSREVGGLVPGTALDAGCGEGAEATWLASNGWQVTAADISAEALTRAATRAAASEAAEHAADHAAAERAAGRGSAGRAAGRGSAGRGSAGRGSAGRGSAGRGSAGRGSAGRVQWVEADLSVWEPSTQYDLVMTHYAHPAMPQLEFYDRLATWVAPGGTLLIVGHLHTHTSGHDHHPPAEASATAAAITARLDLTDWEVVTAEEQHRTLAAPGGREATLHDVIVRATRHR